MKRKSLKALCKCLLLGTLLAAGSLAGSVQVQAAPLQNGEELLLWQGKAPGSEKVSFHNEIIERSKTPEVYHDRAMVTIDTPSMVAHVPENPNGTAVIIAPGGGYARVVIDKEGGDIAQWLNEKGVTVMILRYRLPQDAHKNRQDVALEDGQRAMRMVRTHAKEWGLNPEKIGIMGFSAGGHLAASVSTCYDRQVYKATDAVDTASARPDFSVLGYPVISMLPEYAHNGTKKRLLGDAPSMGEMKKYSTELFVNAQTPPAFVFCAADDDVVPPVNSFRYYEAMRKAGVEGELHVFRTGGHGFGLGGRLTTSAKDWKSACENWMRDLDLIE